MGDEDFTTEMLKTKPHLQQHHDPNYAERVAAKSIDRQETREVRRALRELGDCVYQRHGILFKLFREFEKMTHERFVTHVQIKKGLDALGITFKLEDIDRVILHLYPDGDLNKVEYVHFFKGLISSHHDFSMVR